MLFSDFSCMFLNPNNVFRFEFFKNQTFDELMNSMWKNIFFKSQKPIFEKNIWKYWYFFYRLLQTWLNHDKKCATFCLNWKCQIHVQCRKGIILCPSNYGSKVFMWSLRCLYLWTTLCCYKPRRSLLQGMFEKYVKRTSRRGTFFVGPNSRIYRTEFSRKSQVSRWLNISLHTYIKLDIEKKSSNFVWYWYSLQNKLIHIWIVTNYKDSILKFGLIFAQWHGKQEVCQTCSFLT